MKKLRGIWGITVAILVIFSAFVGSEIFFANAASGPTTAGLNDLSGYGIANEVSAVWGLNHTGSTAHWYSLPFTVNNATQTITFTTPANEKISLVIVQTKNVSQTVYNFLQNGALYTYSTFSLTGVNTNLTDAFMYFGYPVNATSVNAVADKGITGAVMNQTLYDAQASYFGTQIQMSPIYMPSSHFPSTAQYAFYLNQSKNTTGYQSATISFSQQFEYTQGQQYPLATYIGALGLGILAVASYIVYLASPEHDGTEEERAASFQTRKELGVTLLGIAGIIGVLIIEGFVGKLIPQGGWAAALASLALGAIVGFSYTEIPKRQMYKRTVGWILVGVIVGFVINLFFPFASVEYNFMTSRNLVDLANGWYFVVFFVIMMYYALMNTKRYKLRHRHHVRERELRRHRA